MSPYLGVGRFVNVKAELEEYWCEGDVDNARCARFRRCVASTLASTPGVDGEKLL